MLTASLRNWWSHPDGWFLNLLFPIKPGSSREKGQQGEWSCGGGSAGEGASLDLLVIDTRAVNTPGCGPDSLTKLLFTRPLKRAPSPASASLLFFLFFLLSSFPRNLSPLPLSLILSLCFRPGPEKSPGLAVCVWAGWGNDLLCVFSLFTD